MARRNRPNAQATEVPDSFELQVMLADAKVTRAEAAARCGVSVRTIERYLAPSAEPMPFPLYFTFHALCYGTAPTQEKV